MLGTDVGFVLYWLVSALHLLPPQWLFAHYDDPILTAWNWSFLPLDLLVSASATRAIHTRRRASFESEPWLLIALTCTSVSGLMAIAFWSLRREFDPGWWGFNLFLLLWPLPYLAKIVGRAAAPVQ
jgi:hypothetical protein